MKATQWSAPRTTLVQPRGRSWPPRSRCSPGTAGCTDPAQQRQHPPRHWRPSNRGAHHPQSRRRRSPSPARDNSSSAGSGSAATSSTALTPAHEQHRAAGEQARAARRSRPRSACTSGSTTQGSTAVGSTSADSTPTSPEAAGRSANASPATSDHAQCAVREAAHGRAGARPRRRTIRTSAIHSRWTTQSGHAEPARPAAKKGPAGRGNRRPGSAARRRRARGSRGAGTATGSRRVRGEVELRVERDPTGPLEESQSRNRRPLTSRSTAETVQLPGATDLTLTSARRIACRASVAAGWARTVFGRQVRSRDEQRATRRAFPATPSHRGFDGGVGRGSDVPGWLKEGQAQVALRRGRRLPAGARVVEIGSHQGRST